MIKRKKRLISKLLFLAVCTSSIQNIIVFQGKRVSAKENAPSTVQVARKTAAVSKEKEVDKASIESDFTFDEKTEQ